MKFKSVKFYLHRLITDGHRWQNIDINGQETKPLLFFSSLQWGFVVLSVLAGIFIKEGVNKDFVGYIIASLSVFIGLFLTLILTVFDKFQQMNFNPTNPSEKGRTLLIQRKNFFKQFTALTSYSILLAISCIFLLSISLLISETMNVDLSNFELVTSIDKVSFASILLGTYYWLILIYRILIVYLFLDFLLMVIYALTSMYNFIALEYDKKKIN